ncbi:MAG: protein GrpE [Candidatus Mesenet longicola]|uniref:Protein GrpE n=1 Tax=Candidatus Mesenet longicola TaxID=1892558 RepID=A0A8J3HWY7_9RICK|nr:MAG: protein GrpE [Candidatus Mesenet longicola]GHM59801.1 MAG: protein GrpE [Candidatus Mesenet longicola]
MTEDGLKNNNDQMSEKDIKQPEIRGLNKKDFHSNQAQRKEENLSQGLSVLKERVSHLESQLRLAIADKENLKRIMERDIDEKSSYAITSFARDLISSCDNLERALASLDENDPTHNGVSMTWKEIANTLQKHGIERFDPLNLIFNPNLHQTVSKVVDDTKEPGTITAVLQCGYTIKKRLLRPAMVVISEKSPDTQPASQ